ncbi:hypothetical protein BZG36_01635 [Bifiguratus adelaidae]|uniref:Uncharacterized protein n=1 Tax=Bifiguratus adelaidae TaxID=1938954 RepID=A0A261Y4B5_9FUNG|nr:hypothetical protein BZG36_01635 [Bifiguratus adelaidae]
MDEILILWKPPQPEGVWDVSPEAIHVQEYWRRLQYFVRLCHCFRDYGMEYPSPVVPTELSVAWPLDVVTMEVVSAEEMAHREVYRTIVINHGNEAFKLCDNSLDIDDTILEVKRAHYTIRDATGQPLTWDMINTLEWCLTKLQILIWQDKDPQTFFARLPQIADPAAPPNTYYPLVSWMMHATYRLPMHKFDKDQQKFLREVEMRFLDVVAAAAHLVTNNEEFSTDLDETRNAIRDLIGYVERCRNRNLAPMRLLKVDCWEFYIGGLIKARRYIDDFMNISCSKGEAQQLIPPPHHPMMIILDNITLSPSDLCSFVEHEDLLKNMEENHITPLPLPFDGNLRAWWLLFAFVQAYTKQQPYAPSFFEDAVSPPYNISMLLQKLRALVEVFVLATVLHSLPRITQTAYASPSAFQSNMTSFFKQLLELAALHSVYTECQGHMQLLKITELLCCEYKFNGTTLAAELDGHRLLRYLRGVALQTDFLFPDLEILDAFIHGSETEAIALSARCASVLKSGTAEPPTKAEQISDTASASNNAQPTATRSDASYVQVSPGPSVWSVELVSTLKTLSVASSECPKSIDDELNDTDQESVGSFSEFRRLRLSDTSMDAASDQLNEMSDGIGDDSNFLEETVDEWNLEDFPTEWFPT